ncbi:MAG: sulfatase-like hydrolase/transferase, partial [Lachnospiraceae bacterium]|nr:sulfatase-like hydrolase/transferase [Lachnospiraceae bacterium]
DRAMEYLLNQLEEKGILDKTLIVLVGDHYPYNISEAGRDSLAGHPVDPSIERYHSTCIMYNAGLKEPIVSDTYCCNVDIFPTVLNLFGIKYDSRLLAGRDIFSSGVHRAMLYNKTFLSDMVTYNNETGSAVWTEKAADWSEERKAEYLETMISLNESEYAASIKMLSKNFYFYLWRNSALMTQEEIDTENDREARVNATAAELRAIDEQKAAEEAARKAREEMVPLLDENGNQVLDENGNPVMVAPEPAPETPAEGEAVPEGQAPEAAPETPVEPAPEAPQTEEAPAPVTP